VLSEDEIKRVLEAALLAVSEPLNVDRLFKLFAAGELNAEDGRAQIRAALKSLTEDATERGLELKRVASGYRYQIKQELSPWVSRLWEEKPPRYSRALMETLALITYKQPVTRGDIEDVRGVSVSQNIMRTLLERGWIREVGQREVPGRPSLYGTTKAFLDYFNVKSLDELPELPEIKALIDPLAEIDEPQPTPEIGSEAGAAIEVTTLEIATNETAPIALDSIEVEEMPPNPGEPESLSEQRESPIEEGDSTSDGGRAVESITTNIEAMDSRASTDEVPEVAKVALVKGESEKEKPTLAEVVPLPTAGTPQT